MALNKQKGNMYDFITHTWNTVKGACYHDCSYCYMKRFKNQKPVRFDEKELKTDLGKDNFIFVGSSCDMWAENIKRDWLIKTLEYCSRFDNQYLFQTKNPAKLIDEDYDLYVLGLEKSKVCVTIESNLHYKRIMGNSPHPLQRFRDSMLIKNPLYITIEPIIDFNLSKFIYLLKDINPIQINIGADSGNNNLPEPPKEKILELIKELEKFTKVKQKSNLKRLLL